MSDRPSSTRPSVRNDDKASSGHISHALREGSSKSTTSNEPSTEASSVPPQTSSATPRTPFTPSTDSVAQAHFRVPASPRISASGMPSGEPSAKSAKVAIPRLKRTLDAGEPGSKPGGRHRVTHACEPCRHRKTKCSGERPTCRHCQDFKIQCYYADGKRDRVKKQFGSMQDKVADYERVLKDLATRVSDPDADLIRLTLDRAARMDVDESVAETPALNSVELDGDTEASGAESEASGGRGSTGALDRTEEDFTREGAKATGFMGKNSDITWLQRLHQENAYGEAMDNDSSDADHNKEHSVDQGFSIQESSYHLNDLAISTYQAVDPYEIPTQEHAQILFVTYMNRVHPSFPIVGRINLQNQFAKFFARPSSRPPAKWLAIVNMIFAIAAKYSHLIQADWQADDRDHLIYFTRARMLAIDADTLFNHPDLQMIQLLGLMSLYLMANDQINRSWCLAGLAVRSATALGINMRNESPDLSNSLKEIRYRLWWALYALEHRLCAMTGRVNCILDDHCTTPLPVPIDEEDFETELGKKLLSKEHQRTNRAPSSNANTPSAKPESTPSSRSGSNRAETNSRSPSTAQPQPQGQAQSQASSQLEDWTKDITPNSALYFLHLVQLSRLTQHIFHKLYNPTAIEGHWSDIQSQIGNLNQQLENWYRKLPAAFDFRRKQRDRDFYEARLALGFYYYGTAQMLHRPCLCRLDRKIPGQSSKSNEFNHAAATTCVISAQEQLALIPDEPNAVGLLRVGPWVNILHLLVQSATVIMLEISFRVHHMPQQADELLESAKKSIRWLHALGEDNLAAARAWRQCNQLLQEAASKIGRTVTDLPTHPPRSAVSASDDTNMSGGTAAQSFFEQNAAHDQASTYPQTSMPYSGQNMPDVNAFASGVFDPFMHYDQLFPMSGNVDQHHMQYAQNANQMQYGGMHSDANMNFMHQFQDQQDDLPSGGASQGGRSRYN